VFFPAGCFAVYLLLVLLVLLVAGLVIIGML
jgi:hypothetical protein